MSGTGCARAAGDGGVKLPENGRRSNLANG